jgi:4-amino-4-deoxy-L-arabinose transferase-like glycosyltransferase
VRSKIITPRLSDPDEKTLPANRLFQCRFLILAAAIWHLSVAVAIFAAGRFQLFSSSLQPSGLFSLDSIVYQVQCVALGEMLRSQGVVAWATWPSQLHLRLYALPLAAIRPQSGFNILMVEPVNLIFYLATLVLIFKLGEAIFDYQGGLIAAGVVALWPSLLLHTTQLLRDPLLILAVVVLMWNLVKLLHKQLRFTRGVLMALVTTATVVIIRIVRLPMWYIVCAMVGTAVLLFAVQAWRERHVATGSLVFALVMITAVLATPRFQPWFQNQHIVRPGRTSRHEVVERFPIAGQIRSSRSSFEFRADENGKLVPAEKGSQIDTGLTITGWWDIVRQVPRALEIGFLAPFPYMWFQTGHLVGLTGRLLSGIETSVTYVLECLALFGLWRARRRPSAWLLAVFILLGAVSLGLAVNNIGALYRLRYPFWIMIVILGAGGFDHFRRTVLKHSSRFV